LRELDQKEFLNEATRLGIVSPETCAGFINPETFESVVPRGSKTRLKTHEIGHETYHHLEDSLNKYGRMEPSTKTVDDEIEAEIYSYKMMNKRLTPRVGLQAIWHLMINNWDPYKAISLVIGRLKSKGIQTSYKDRLDLVRIVERQAKSEFSEWKGW
jgi:hypothetical protein